MNNINSNFTNKYIELKKDGISQQDLKQLKNSLIEQPISLKDAQLLKNELQKDGKIDSDEKVLLQAIGSSAKDSLSAQKLADSIEPKNVEISQMIMSGFKSKVGNTTSSSDISKMSSQDKIIEAFKGSLKYVGPELRAKLEQMLTPQNLAIMGGVMAGYVASHAVGAGFVADIAMAGIGAIALGSDVIDVAQKLYGFAQNSVNAKTPKDLDIASRQLGSAMATIVTELPTILGARKFIKTTKSATLGKINTTAATSSTVGRNATSVTPSKPFNLPFKRAVTSSTSGAPVSSGFRQYSVESAVGNAGKSWIHTLTRGIPSPEKLAEIKGSSKVTGAKAFDGVKIQGSTIEQIVKRIPKEAQLRELQPLVKDGKVVSKLEGFEFGWIDKATDMDYRVRIHGPDANVMAKNPTSTAAQGWIVRLERNPMGDASFPKTEYLTIDGKFEKASDLIKLETQQKAIQQAIASATSGEVPKALGSATVGGSVTDLQKQLSIIENTIEHFHHNSHIGVGGGLNKAIK